MGGKTAFVGRSVELTLLRRSLVEGRSVLVSGPPGVGKTRLVSEVLDRLDPVEFVVFQVRCVDATIPFGPLLSLLDLGVSPIGDPAEIALRVQGVIRASVGSAGGADRRPVLSVDDAHRADASTAALVAQLVGDGSCAVALTVPDGEELPEPVARLVGRGELARVEVAPMDDSDGAIMVRRVLGGDVDRSTLGELLLAGGGLPLFLEELARSGAESGMLQRSDGRTWSAVGPLVVSDRITSVIGDRLDRLDRPARDLVETLAIADRPIGASVLVALSDTATVGRLEDSGFVVSVQESTRSLVVLKHGLVGEAARARLSSERVRTLAGRLLQVLTERAETGPVDWNLVGRLVATTDQDDPALLMRSAQAATEIHDGALALDLAERASATVPGPQAALLRAVALGQVGRHDEARAVFGMVIAQADPDLRTAGYLAAANHLVFDLGDPEAAIELLETALGELDGQNRRMASGFLATVLFFSGRTEEAIAAGMELVSSPEPIPLLSPSGITAACAISGLPDEVLSVFHRVTTETFGAQEPGFTLDLAGRVSTLNLVFNRVLALWQQGRLGEAVDPLEALREVTDTTMFDAGIQLPLMRATTATLRGHGMHARALAAPLTAELCAGPVPIAAYNLSLLATATALTGDVPQARTVLSLMDEYPPEASAGFWWWLERARVWTRAAEGDVAGAAARSMELADLDRRHQFHRMCSLHDAVRFGAAATALDGARSTADRPGRTWWDDMVVDHAAAAAARDAGGLLDVAARFEHGAMDLFAAEAATQAATFARKDHDLLLAAEAESRAVRCLQVCGGAVTPILSAVPATLTPREAEVARMVASGFTNRAIAERLGTSVRTVGNQLQSVFHKLGISSRLELRDVLS